MATSGGSEEAEAIVDPDILTIAPHLMKTAPVFFSSNMTETEINNKREVIFDAISTQKMEIVDIDDESSTTIEDDNSESLVFIETEAKINLLQKLIWRKTSVMATKSKKESTTLSTTLCSLKESVNIPKGKSDNIKRKNREIELLDTEKKLKIQRVQQLMSEEAELARIRQTHEEKMFKMKEEHLREVNNMQLQHLKEIHAIEIQINRTKLKSIDCSFKDKENHPYV